MATLSKEQILKKTEGDKVVEYFIPVPGYEGSVDIRAIRTLGEFDHMMKEQKKLEVARDNLHEISLAGRTNDQIAMAVTLSACMVEPELDSGEDGLYGEAFQFIDNLGIAAMGIVNRISEISGMTEDAVKRRESELRKDTFQALANNVVRDILEKDAAGVRASDDGIVVGSPRVVEDKSRRGGEGEQE